MRAVALGLALVVGLAACGSGGGFPDAPRLVADAPHPGSFSLAWTLADAQQQPVTCAQAGATTVVVAVKDEATGDALAATFPCSIGTGVSGAVAAGTYDLAFSLASDSATVATAPAQTGVAIAPDQTATVTPVVFVIGS